jgi:hypothetical protein
MDNKTKSNMERKCSNCRDSETSVYNEPCNGCGKSLVNWRPTSKKWKHGDRRITTQSNLIFERLFRCVEIDAYFAELARRLEIKHFEEEYRCDHGVRKRWHPCKCDISPYSFLYLRVFDNPFPIQNNVKQALLRLMKHLHASGGAYPVADNPAVIVTVITDTQAGRLEPVGLRLVSTKI